MDVNEGSLQVIDKEAMILENWPIVLLYGTYLPVALYFVVLDEKIVVGRDGNSLGQKARKSLRAQCGEEGVGRKKSGPITTCTKRSPGVWHGGGLKSDCVGGRGLGCGGHGGGAGVYGRAKERGGRRR